MKKIFPALIILASVFFIPPHKVFAQVQSGPIPAPAPIPCANTGNPEFNSLRPYQASPCTVEPDNYAKFCGNDLTLHDTITETYPGGGSCVTTGNTVNCTYTVPVTKPVTINLSGATLPFMGNTEDVPNSQPPTSTTPLTDADKMNGYVSWYLNGVMNRAEDGSLKTTDSTTTNYNLVNFSGPLNKLLPGAIADAQRVQTINNVAANTNHNQIVVCADPDNSGLFGGLLDLLGIGKYKAKECYAGNNTAASGNKVLRLSDWNNTYSFNVVANAAVKIWLAGLKLLYPNAADAIEKSVGNHWIYAKPPLPWDDGTGKAFSTEDEYEKAYQEWRGNACAIIPVINKVVCINNIFVPSYYADLYPYVPLSSTEDLKGSISIDSVSSATSPTTGGVTVSGVTFSNQTPSTLFFPHLQETSELATSLQNTFVSQDETNNETANPTSVAPTSSCSTVEVRSNKGDKLFATQLSGTLNYTANFTCTFNPITTTTDPDCMQHCLVRELDPSVCQSECQRTTPTQTCTKDTYISLSTIGSIPKVDDIWSQLVAGPESIFKKIFPKTNTAGSVGTIMDIPGSTSITYTGLGISQQNADLKFPHIGGISEYFLNGIQTALRPKGYGSPITFAPTVGSNNVPSGVCDGSVFKKYNPPGQTTSEAANYFNTYVKPRLTPYLISVYKEAEKETGLPCEVFAGLHYIEGGSDPNLSLISGRPLGTPEPDEGNRVFATLLDTAVYVAGKIQGKVGGHIDTWQQMVTALSRYNGGGNSNCKTGVPYFNVPGNCPPLYEGEDDIYPLGWIDQKHATMYQIYCADGVLCNPPMEITRPGIMSIATDFYHSEK
jgi:hypothetical protein